MLALRVLSGVIAVPLLVGLVVWGGMPYVLGTVLFATLGTWELFWMLRAAGRRPLVAPGLLVAAGIVLDARTSDGLLPAVLAFVAVATLAWLMLRADWSGALEDWALTLTPGLYVGGLLRFFVPLREAPDGAFWVLTVLACTWMCDTVAYFVGGAIGRTKLAPRISPGKSVEGAAAGILTAALVGIAAAAISGYPLPRLIGLGLAIGICTVLGDLLESFIKRLCRVKDSGTLVPGHGGLLDRMDSLLLAGAGAYFYVVATA